VTDALPLKDSARTDAASTSGFPTTNARAMLAASIVRGPVPKTLLNRRRMREPPSDTWTSWRRLASRHFSGASTLSRSATICEVPHEATQCSVDGAGCVDAQAPSTNAASNAASTLAKRFPC